MSHRDERRMPGERGLRLLLGLAPRRFRDRHGPDLIECHRDAWVDRASRGVTARVGFAAAAYAGMVATVMREWTRALRGKPTQTREAGGMGWRTEGTGWNGTMTELRLALRRLRRCPGLTAVCVLTLGLGLGANTAVFDVTYSVLLAPLPYEDSEQLVRIYGSRLDRPGEFDRLHLPNPATRELRDEVSSLAAVAILEHHTAEGVDLTSGDRPERARLLRVNAEYFDVLRVSPVLGRTFDRSEEVEDARMAVVRESVWQRHMGGDPARVGGSLLLDGEAVTVVGVVSDTVRDPVEGVVDVWVPSDLQGDQADFWDNNYLTVVARLRPDAGLVRLRSELDVLHARHADLPSASEVGFVVVPLQDDLVAGVRPLLYSVMGAVGFLLLLTCVNLASLLLASAADRQHEMAVRTSLGCSRISLVRQFVIETATLALAGGVAGVAIGFGALELLLAVAPPELSLSGETALGAPSILFAGLASVVIGTALGLAASLPFTGSNLRPVTGSARSDGAGGGRPRLRSALVSVEVAMAVVLLTGAGVLLRTVQQLQARDIGADPAGVLVFEVGLPTARYETDEARYRFNEQFHAALRTLPGVTAAAATSRLPVTGSFNTWGTRRAHAIGDPFDVDNIQVNQRWIAGEPFEVAGLHLVAGRLFSTEDEAGAPYKTVVNQTLVARLFGDEPPLGEIIRMGGRYTEIVGVVEDEALSVRGAPAPIAYHHQRQWISGSGKLTQMVSVAGDPLEFVPAVRAELAKIDADLVLFQPGLLSDVIGGGMAQERFAAQLLLLFAGLAMLLAGLGLYGLLSHQVRRRRHEIGVRIALGADRAGVVGLVVRTGVRLTVVGALFGIVLAAALSSALEAFVFEVSPRDPLVMTMASLSLIVVAILSSVLPATRATRVDAVESLRAE